MFMDDIELCAAAVRVLHAAAVTQDQALMETLIEVSRVRAVYPFIFARSRTFSLFL